MGRGDKKTKKGKYLKDHSVNPDQQDAKKITGNVPVKKD